MYGLYGAFVPVLVYSLFGSSKQLGTGPVAVTSLLIANGRYWRGCRWFICTGTQEGWVPTAPMSCWAEL